MTGQELLHWADWPWRDCLQLPRLRYVRLTATSPTYGPVTLVTSTSRASALLPACQADGHGAASDPGLDTAELACTPLPVAEASVGRGSLPGAWGSRLLWPSRLAALGRPGPALYGPYALQRTVTMEEIVFSLKHHWRFLDSKPWNYTDFHGTSTWRPHEY